MKTIYRKGLVHRGCKDFRIRQGTLSKPGLLKGYDSLIDFRILDSMNFNKFFVDFHGDKTYIILFVCGNAAYKFIPEPTARSAVRGY